MFWGILVAATALAADPPAAVQAITVSLVPTLENTAGCTVPKMRLAPPEGEWKLPELTGQRPLYGIYEFRGKKLLMVLDRTQRSMRYYDRLWIDLNGNGDLTDETPLTTEQFSVAQFKNVKIPYEANGQSREYFINADFYFDEGPYTSLKALPDELLEKTVIANLRPQRRAGGAFELNGKTFEIEIADATAEGFYNTRLKQVEPAFPDAERLWVHGDWVFLYEKVQRWEYRWILGDLLSLENQLYRVTVDENGEWLKLEPEPGPLVTLDLAQEPDRISLATTDFAHEIMAYRPGKALQVPSGEYRLLDYVLMRDDKEGNRWLLRGDSRSKYSPIMAGDPRATVVFGEPITVLLKAWDIPSDVQFRPGLSLWIRGSGDEEINALYGIPKDKIDAVLADDDEMKPNAPKYKITTEDGEVVKSGEFEYG